MRTTKKIEIPKKTVLIGEIGLGGQLRSVAQIQLRLKEAERLGFTSAIIPKETSQDSHLETNSQIEVKAVSNINEALNIALNIEK